MRRRSSRLNNLISSAEEMIDTIGDVASPRIRSLRKEIRSSLPGMKRQARRYSKQGMSMARGARDVAIGSARQYPWMTLLVGAAVAVYALNATRGSRHD